MGSAYQINKQEQVHILTFQVVGWVDIFTRQEYRDIILASFTYCRQEKYAIILVSFLIPFN